jgi:hypothetical protein
MMQQLKWGASLFAVIVVAAGIGGARPAAAQSAQSIQSIQQQIQELQRQLRQLQNQAVQRDAQLKQAQDEAAQARAAAAQAAAASQLVVPPTAAPGSAIVTIPPNDVDPATGKKFYNPKKPNGTFNIGGVTVSLGGFVDFTTWGRTRNMNRGPNTAWATIPFRGPTSQGDTGEWNATADITRLSLKATANPSPDQTLLGYVEADFQNGAGGTNQNQSNSYTPRMRHAFGEWAYDPWQAYVIAGQTWSLATPFRSALDPFSTWQPPTIDQNYTVGYNYLRVPLARIVKGVGPAWFGLEAAAPATIFGGSTPTIPGGAVVTSFPGSGGLNPQANYTLNYAPDILAKGAVDTKFGHYELYGIGRFFQDQVTRPLNAANSAGTVKNFYASGAGIGATSYVHLLKYADFEGDILYGSGVGRYGSSQLPDATFAANGSIKPLRNLIGTAGIVGHATKMFDLYFFYGYEGVSSSFADGAGYGNPTKSNIGCYNPNASATTPATIFTTCTGNTARLNEYTIGYTWKLLKGSYGTLLTGLQYAYIQRNVFGSNFGGSPTAVNNMFYANLRYIPFE